MISGKKSSSSSKRLYERPQVTKITSSEAKAALKANAIPGDAAAEVMLGQLNGREDVMNTHEVEIQKELEKLYEQLNEFSEPTPADQPNEYEVEELEAWEKLRERIRTLENELAEITGQQS